MKEDEQTSEEQRRKDIEAVVKILVKDVEVTHKLNGYYFYRNH
jgi:hypothetical protein